MSDWATKKKYRKKQYEEVWAKKISTNEEAMAASMWLDSQEVDNWIVMGEITALDIKDESGIWSVPWNNYLVQAENNRFFILPIQYFETVYEEV